MALQYQPNHLALEPSKESSVAVVSSTGDAGLRGNEGGSGHEATGQVHPPFFRSTLFQAAVIAGVFFCGPGMATALGALGAGGLQSPTLVNITTGISFGGNVLFSLLTGVFVNIFGVRLTLSLGVVGFSLHDAALYCNNRYGNGAAWFLYFESALNGVLSALLWVVQAAIMMAYPEPDFKGRFISIWYSSIALGSTVGGIIALGFNARHAEAGKLTPYTYIPLITVAALGPFIALLLSAPDKVIRRDGVKVQRHRQPNASQEARRVFSALQRVEVCHPLGFESPTILIVAPSIVARDG
ncbi:hypothetical protein LTR93_011777 [Exophiala xenobiotica]|nr:hypothetical protein LTR93_011777 [Exophiala xenobiotica]